MMDTSELHQVALHSMDWGSLAGTISSGGHRLTITPGYADCGVTWEDVTCSCGFASRYFSGHGCWQHGHDGPPVEHMFDCQHEVLYAAAQEWLRGQERLN